jgi:hypothetical protein
MRVSVSLGGVRKDKSPVMKQKRKRKEPVNEHSKEQLSNDNPSQNQSPSLEIKEDRAEAKPQKSAPVFTGPSSGALTKAEEKETGLVSFKIYWYYFKAGGAYKNRSEHTHTHTHNHIIIPTLPQMFYFLSHMLVSGLFLFSLISLFLIFFSGANVLSSWWLSVWSNPTNYPQFSGFSEHFCKLSLKLKASLIIEVYMPKRKFEKLISFPLLDRHMDLYRLDGR